MDATVDGDMEVVATLINDGVDMNAVICEVRYGVFHYPYEVQLIILNQAVMPAFPGFSTTTFLNVFTLYAPLHTSIDFPRGI